MSEPAYFHRRVFGRQDGRSWLNIDRVGSWDSHRYSRFGFWRWGEGRGLTLRYRGWLLMLRFGPYHRPANERATALGPQDIFLLDQWARQLIEAFGETPYLVGSAARAERNWRDIDLRMVDALGLAESRPLALRALNVVTPKGQKPLDPTDPNFKLDALYMGRRQVEREPKEATMTNSEPAQWQLIHEADGAHYFLDPKGNQLALIDHEEMHELLDYINALEQERYRLLELRDAIIPWQKFVWGHAIFSPDQRDFLNIVNGPVVEALENVRELVRTNKCCCDTTHFHPMPDGSLVGIRSGNNSRCTGCAIHGDAIISTTEVSDE